MADIEIYRSPSGAVTLDVTTDGDTVWLTQRQMADLFGRDLRTVNDHIANAGTEELAGEATIRKYRIVRPEGGREVEREIAHYNLDMILSVGYRVKSPEGVLFRRWANDVLKRYLIAGVARNDARMRQLETYAEMLQRSDDDTVSGIAEVLKRFSTGFQLLDEYDHGTLPDPSGDHPTVRLDYGTARAVVDEIRDRFPRDTMFGAERGDSFRGILGQIEQTFGGEDLYSSTQEKAAHLLYFVVKDHPFSDGNKRSAAALFTHYLNANDALEAVGGEHLISGRSLAAITLMTAMSKPEEKDSIIRLLCSLLAR